MQIKWIGKGFVVSKDPNDSCLLRKTDHGLLNYVFPLVESLLSENLIKQWYSSRRGPDSGDPRSRVRAYLNIKCSDEEKITEKIKAIALNVEVIDESTQYNRNYDFTILQKASEVAKNLLPVATNTDRWSNALLIQVDKAINQNPSVRNHDGVHWIENNLGLGNCFLLKRYNII